MKHITGIILAFILWFTTFWFAPDFVDGEGRAILVFMVALCTGGFLFCWFICVAVNGEWFEKIGGSGE